VNSVMIRPHPPRFLMKRRKTVSVTPAIGASTVAGEIVTLPICKLVGNARACAGIERAPPPAAVSVATP
jgi:hypothetical protein